MRPVPTAQRTERARKQERPLGTLRLRAPHAKRCAFSHPDCTVGSGVSPDHAPAEPLPLAGSTADRELAALPPHPAPKACKNLQLAAIVPPWPAAGSPSAGGRAGPHSAFGISPPPRGRARFGRCADTRTGEPGSGDVPTPERVSRRRAVGDAPPRDTASAPPPAPPRFAPRCPMLARPHAWGRDGEARVGASPATEGRVGPLAPNQTKRPAGAKTCGTLTPLGAIDSDRVPA
jgi:hypothetical protein